MNDDAAEVATNTPTPANDDASLAASLEAIRAAAEPAAAPPAAPPVATPSPATPATTPAADVLVLPDDDEARLIAQAKKRAEERRALEPLEHVQRKLSDVEAALAKAPGTAAILQAVQAKDPAALANAFRALGVDPAAVQQLATRAQLAPTPQDQIRAVVQEALAPVLEAIKPKAQQAEPGPTEGTAKAAYAEYLDATATATEGKPRWPNIEEQRQRLGGEVVAEMVMAYTKSLASQGVDVRQLTDEQLSSMFEKRLSSRVKPPGAPTIASGEPSSPSSGTSTASGGPTKSTSAPRSLTNGHAADAVRSLPRSSREIDAELARELDAIKRAAG